MISVADDSRQSRSNAYTNLPARSCNARAQASLVAELRGRYCGCWQTRCARAKGRDARHWQQQEGKWVVKSRTGRLLLVTVSNDESRPLPTFIEEDYDLRIESKGSDALRCLRDTSDVDLVLLYGSPSDISSLQLVRLIREQQPRQRLPLIMLARNATPEEVTLAFAHGADNCLTGPVPAELLKARVAALIEQKRGYEQVQAKSAALEETDGQRLQIFRMATHDVQSPLNNILLAEQILRRILPTERTEVEQSLNMIRDMAVNIGYTLTNYLGLLELRTGLLNYHLQPINLRDVIMNVVNQHKFAATDQGHPPASAFGTGLGQRRCRTRCASACQPGQQRYKIQPIQ